MNKDGQHVSISCCCAKVKPSGTAAGRAAAPPADEARYERRFSRLPQVTQRLQISATYHRAGCRQTLSPVWLILEMRVRVLWDEIFFYFLTAKRNKEHPSSSTARPASSRVTGKVKVYIRGSLPVLYRDSQASTSWADFFSICARAHVFEVTEEAAVCEEEEPVQLKGRTSNP